MGVPASGSQQVYIFKQGPIREAAKCIEERSANDNALITEARKHGIESRQCRIGAKQPVRMIELQAECADLKSRIVKMMIQNRKGILRQLRVGMKKYEPLPGCLFRAGIALSSSSTFGMNNASAHTACFVNRFV